MISEYALDPELVAQWHDPKEWAFYREAFSAETGRVASAYPRRWRREVVRTFHQLFPGATSQSMERQRLEVLLDRLGERMVQRESSHPECPTWFEKVIAEHRERRFHGILSTTRDANVPEVMTPDMLFSAHLPAAWTVKSSPAPPRTAEAFAQAVEPLLSRCREVVFVDPWFNPSEKRFREPLRKMLAVLWGPGCCVSTPSAQLVIAEGTRDPQWLLGECQEKLPWIMPEGHELQVTVLRQRAGGEKVHNRYMLPRSRVLVLVPALMLPTTAT